MVCAHTKIYYWFDKITTTGERYATINMHYLLHLTDMVKDLGPLWANSCYEFENANSTVEKLFHGTKKIGKNKFCDTMNYFNIDNGVSLSNSVLSFRVV